MELLGWELRLHRISSYSSEGTMLWLAGCLLCTGLLTTAQCSEWSQFVKVRTTAHCDSAGRHRVVVRNPPGSFIRGIGAPRWVPGLSWWRVPARFPTIAQPRAGQTRQHFGAEIWQLVEIVDKRDRNSFEP
jgi:hypothetical protein